MSTIICKNCTQHFKGNFCPNCGQSASIEKINAKYFLHDIPHSLFHINKGFFYTLINLLKHPGKTLREYLEGKRVSHYKPFGFVIVLTTICVLLISGIENAINHKYMLLHPGYKLNFKNNLFAKYPSILIFAMIPLLSLVTWLFLRKKKYNFWEHFLVNTYLAAHLNIFLLLINIYKFIRFYITENWQGFNYTIFLTIFMTYYGFAFGRLLNEKRDFKHFTYIFVMVIFMSVIYITALSYAGLMTSWWNFKN